MLTVADMGEGGVKNHVKSADELYGWSLSITRNYCSSSWHNSSNLLSLRTSTDDIST